MQESGEVIMKVIVKEVGKNPEVKDIEDKLEVYQEIVDGCSIEVVPLLPHVGLICCGEGKLKNKPANIVVDKDIIVGNIVIVGTSGEDFRSLTDSEIFLVQVFLLVCNLR